MGHYAKVQGSVVVDVLVADAEFVATLPQEEGIEYIKTSYNTYEGVHYMPNTDYMIPSDTPEKSLRKNYAGSGMIYDRELDMFYMPQPFESWSLNTEKGKWEAPVPYPTDGAIYDWDEDTLSWIKDTE
jgi:hypothetical protein